MDADVAVVDQDSKQAGLPLLQRELTEITHWPNNGMRSEAHSRRLFKFGAVRPAPDLVVTFAVIYLLEQNSHEETRQRWRMAYR